MLVGCFVSTILEEGPNPCILILAKIGQRNKFVKYLDFNVMFDISGAV